jgi:hypothetical protein
MRARKITRSKNYAQQLKPMVNLRCFRFFLQYIYRRTQAIATFYFLKYKPVKTALKTLQHRLYSEVQLASTYEKTAKDLSAIPE